MLSRLEKDLRADGGLCYGVPGADAPEVDVSDVCVSCSLTPGAGAPVAAVLLADVPTAEVPGNGAPNGDATDLIAKSRIFPVETLGIRIRTDTTIW